MQALKLCSSMTEPQHNKQIKGITVVEHYFTATPNLTRNVFLVGPMGVGKSTIGKQLAQLLRWTFKDSDKEIEARTGADIPLIFELEGEAGFRKREKNMIAELATESQLVLATGGGVVIFEENREQLKAHGHVVYLHATVDVLLERTAPCRNRPLLQTENPRARLEQIMTERHHLYKEVSDCIVETGNRTVRQVIKSICKQLTQLEKNA